MKRETIPLLVLGFLVCGTAGRAAQQRDINRVHPNAVVSSFLCLPNEASTSVPAGISAVNAVAVGDRAADEHHCQTAIDDYSVAIAAHADNVAALARQAILDMAIVRYTSDRRAKQDHLEAAYADIDRAAALQPQNAEFFLLRAELRMALLQAHVRGRWAFGALHYYHHELDASLADVAQALELEPTWGEAYAYRMQLDNLPIGKNLEQSAFDERMAEKYDPRAADDARANIASADEMREQMAIAKARAQLAMASAMQGLAVAAGADSVIEYRCLNNGLPPACQTP